MTGITGYIYCFSNKIMPGICKIGMTRRNPLMRLKEANISDTWRPPIKYEIEFAKQVLNPMQKEQLIHKILERYNKRVNRDKEFFRATPAEVRDLFELVDGSWWDNKPTNCNLTAETTASSLIASK